MILRIGICLSLGIRPNLVYEEKTSTLNQFSYLGININSKL